MLRKSLAAGVVVALVHADACSQQFSATTIANSEITACVALPATLPGGIYNSIAAGTDLSSGLDLVVGPFGTDAARASVHVEFSVDQTFGFEFRIQEASTMIPPSQSSPASTGVNGGNRILLAAASTVPMQGMLEIGVPTIDGLEGDALVEVDVGDDGTLEVACATTGCATTLSMPITLGPSMPLVITTRTRTGSSQSYNRAGVVIRFRPQLCFGGLGGAFAVLPLLQPGIVGPAPCGTAVQVELRPTLVGHGFRIPSVAPGSIGALVFGFTPPTGLTLPAPPGCGLLVTPDVALVLTPQSDGSVASMLFDIPLGTNFGLQGVVIDPIAGTILTSLGSSWGCE